MKAEIGAVAALLMFLKLFDAILPPSNVESDGHVDTAKEFAVWIVTYATPAAADQRLLLAPWTWCGCKRAPHESGH